MVEIAGLDEVTDFRTGSRNRRFPGIGRRVLALGVELLGEPLWRHAQPALLTRHPTLQVIRDELVRLGGAGSVGCSSRPDPIGLAVDRSDPVAERKQEWQRCALHAEGMEPDTGRQDLVEVIDDSDETFRSMDVAPAHASDANKRPRPERS